MPKPDWTGVPSHIIAAQVEHQRQVVEKLTAHIASVEAGLASYRQAQTEAWSIQRSGEDLLNRREDGLCGPLEDTEADIARWQDQILNGTLTAVESLAITVRCVDGITRRAVLERGGQACVVNGFDMTDLPLTTVVGEIVNEMIYYDPWQILTSKGVVVNSWGQMRDEPTSEDGDTEWEFFAHKLMFNDPIRIEVVA